MCEKVSRGVKNTQSSSIRKVSDEAPWGIKDTPYGQNSRHFF